MIYSVGASKNTIPEHVIVEKRTGNLNIKQTVIAFHGLCQVREEAHEFFGGAKSQSFKSKIMLNPTWRQLFAVAKQQQRATKDEHHIFFEGIYDTGKDDFSVHTNNLPVRIIRLALGS